MVMTVYHLDRIKIAHDELIKVKRLLIDIEQECELHMYDDTRLQSSMINSSLVLLQGVSESLSEILYDNKDLVDDKKPLLRKTAQYTAPSNRLHDSRHPAKARLSSWHSRQQEGGY